MTLLEINNNPRPWMPSPPGDMARICWLLEVVVAATFAVPVDELRAPSRRCASVAFARQCAMYLAHVVLEVDYSTTGLLFNRDRTTAAHAVQLVEERRDDPTIDRLLQMLEEVCGELARGILVNPQVRA